MIRKVAARLLLCAILFSAASMANAFNIYGQWRITKILDAAEIAALPENEAKKLIGTTASILRDRLLFAGTECMKPSYASSRGNSASILREEWHVSSVRMQLPDNIVVVDADCTSLFLDPKQPHRLVLHWEGYFFEAERDRRR